MEKKQSALFRYITKSDNNQDIPARRRGHGVMFIFYLMEDHMRPALIVLSLAYMISCFLAGSFELTFSNIFFFIATAAILPVVVLLTFYGILCVKSWSWQTSDGDWTPYLDIKDDSLARKYKGKKIPIMEMVEAYVNKKIDLVGGKTMYDVLLHRHEIFRISFDWNCVSHYVQTFVSSLSHSIGQDAVEISEVYNRGNDFYNWFLGPTMVYTSGVFRSEDESLEDAQARKLDLVCDQMHMKKGDKHLDLGCGWGTLLAHAAGKYGTYSTGVTLAKEQADWGYQVAQKAKVTDRVDIRVHDYRDLPQNWQFDKITCLEMAEHVGIKNFQTFLHQVKGHLKDDGLFYLQIAGLRRAWDYEDLVWGIFMGKYIFPGADASCPLGFVITQLERAGFEVHRVENTGVHYSLTIYNWYLNWQKNQKPAETKYGTWWWRCFDVFLAWSTIIAAQGSSTVFKILCNKNLRNDKASVSTEEAATSKFAAFGRMDHWVGQNPIATQQ